MSTLEIPGARFKDGQYLLSNVRDEYLDQIKDFKPVLGDVLIATYPKTGTTWMQELSWLVWTRGDISGALSSPVYERIPYMEFSLDENTSPLEILENFSRPCLLKTHLFSNHFLEFIDQGRLKVIIVIRNPKDTLASYYNFYKMGKAVFGGFSGSFDEFFELYRTKTLSYGDYFEWYQNWLPLRHLPNVILVTYEDMKRKLPEVISRVGEFLEKPLPDDVKDDVIQHLSFNSMRDNAMTNNTLVPAFDTTICPFIRKGEIGDWKNYFTQEQSDFVDQAYEKVIQNLGVNLEFE